MNNRKLRDLDAPTPFTLGPRTIAGFRVPISSAAAEHDACRSHTLAVLATLRESSFDLVVVSLADPDVVAALECGRVNLADVSKMLQVRLTSCAIGIRAALEQLPTRRIEWGYAVTEETAPSIRVDFTFTNGSMH